MHPYFMVKFSNPQMLNQLGSLAGRRRILAIILACHLFFFKPYTITLDEFEEGEVGRIRSPTIEEES